MAKIQNFIDLSNIKDQADFQRHGSIAIGNISDAVNGNLEFDNNLNTKTVTVAFDSANTDIMVTHNLGRIPSGFIQSNASANMNVFLGSKAPTKNVSYLQSSAPGTITLIFH